MDDFRAMVDAELTAAGITHVTDPRGLQPPGVLVGPARFRMEAAGRWGRATLEIKVVEPPPGDLDALKGASATAARICDALWDWLESADPGQIPVGDQQLPGYRITVSAPVTGGSCPA